MRPIRAILEMSSAIVSRALGSMSSKPIADGQALEQFLASRAAHAAQTALHGYLKTRMGTQFRQYFEDDAFAGAIRVAQERVFAACLADLTVYAVARCAAEGAEPYAVARFACALGTSLPDGETESACAAFERRTGDMDWGAEHANPGPFAAAAAALVAEAPVSQTFREEDAPILENSLRLRLGNAAEELRRRLDTQAISAEISAGL